MTRVTVTADGNISETAEAVDPDSAAAPTATPGADLPQAPPTPTGQLTVEISELGDPIRVGEATDYEIRIRNARTVADQNVVLKVEFPAGLAVSNGSAARLRGETSARTAGWSKSARSSKCGRARRFPRSMWRPRVSRLANTRSAWW